MSCLNQQDINDNAPAFTLPYYIVDVDQYAKRGSLIGSLTVTDSDKGTNAEFFCTGTSSLSSATTFYSIGSDCGVYLASSLAGLDYGTMMR